MYQTLFYVALALLVPVLIFLLTRNGKSSVANQFMCDVQQHLRRKSWFYLLALGLVLYPFQQYALIRWQESQVSGADQAQAAAIAAGKVVDTLQLYSKFSVAVGAFCLINLLAWAALNMVMPVLADWAKGRYSEDGHAAVLGIDAPVDGFKRTYLKLTGAQRLAFFFVGMGLELLTAGISVDAAFRIQ